MVSERAEPGILKDMLQWVRWKFSSFTSENVKKLKTKKLPKIGAQVIRLKFFHLFWSNYGDPSPGLPRTLLAALEGRLSGWRLKVSCKTVKHISVDSHQLGPPNIFLPTLLCNRYIIVIMIYSSNCGFKYYTVIPWIPLSEGAALHNVLFWVLSLSQFGTPKPRCMPFNRLLQQKEIETFRRTNKSRCLYSLQPSPL